MLKKSILLFLLLTALSCKNDIEVKPKETQQRIKVSSLEREPYLKEVLDRVGFISSKNGRVNGDMAINTDAIIMTLQKDDRSYCYTFAIENRTTATTFTNLIFKRVVGGVKAFYLKYESENLYPFNLSHFTGKITSYDLGFNEITVQYFSKGNLSSPKSGRVQGCQPSVEVKRECLTQDGKSTTTGTDLPCLYGTTHVIYLDYSGCLITDGIGVAGGNLPSQYTQWSNGTFVPTQWFNDGGPGGGPGGGGSGGCGGDGVTTPSNGSDPNSCSDNIGVYVPSPEELNQLLLDKWEDDQINDSQLKPCMQTILTDLKNLTKGSVAQIVQKFAGTVPDYNWEVTDGALNGSVAETNPPGQYNKTTRTIKTTFDSQAWLNATELSWARTILHESVHANLSVFFATDPTKFINTYPQMVQDYGTLKNWNAVHHEEFARSVVNAIADALQEYGQKKGYNLSRQFYEDMSWAGLQSTSTFNNLPQSDKSRILDVIAIEISGKDIQGSAKTQAGKKAGC